MSGLRVLAVELDDETVSSTRLASIRTVFEAQEAMLSGKDVKEIHDLLRADNPTSSASSSLLPAPVVSQEKVRKMIITFQIIKPAEIKTFLFRLSSSFLPSFLLPSFHLVSTLLLIPLRF